MASDDTASTSGADSRAGSNQSLYELGSNGFPPGALDRTGCITTDSSVNQKDVEPTGFSTKPSSYDWNTDGIIMLVAIFVFTFLFQNCACVLVNIRPYQRAILEAHNYYRRLEPASNMRFLVWDLGLEQRAARWADNCFFEHQRRGFGENLAYFTSTGPPVPSRTVIQRSLALWASEKRLWRWSPSCGAACHYTQLIWARTARVGCALSYCPVLRAGGSSRLHRNAMYLACFYTPAGNFVGQYPFIPGPRCSRCGRGARCIGGLCAGGLMRGRRSVKQAPKEEFMGIVQERSEGV